MMRGGRWSARRGRTAIGLLAEALVSGTIAGIATTAAAAAAARREGTTAAAPVNAVSHVVWGDEAGSQDDVSLRYTGTGFVTNHAASVMWAGVYELLRRRVGAGALGALACGPAVSALAYVVDYHMVPRRFTPGYELRLSGRGLGAVYGALALSLPLRALFRGRH